MDDMAALSCYCVLLRLERRNIKGEREKRSSGGCGYLIGLKIRVIQKTYTFSFFWDITFASLVLTSLLFPCGQMPFLPYCTVLYNCKLCNRFFLFFSASYTKSYMVEKNNVLFLLTS